MTPVSDEGKISARATESGTLRRLSRKEKKKKKSENSRDRDTRTSTSTRNFNGLPFCEGIFFLLNF